MPKLETCKHCPRLRLYLAQLRQSHPDYWNLPVPASGPEDAPLLIVGLAPGKHGANKTGLPFIGDASGDMLWTVIDMLGIRQKVRITNAVKCVPPANLPYKSEMNNCQKFLLPEIETHLARPGKRAILCLGLVAHRMTLKSLGLKLKTYPFSHGACHDLPVGSLLSSYHCSRYNTQTGRLTLPMFKSAVELAAIKAGILQQTSR